MHGQEGWLGIEVGAESASFSSGVAVGHGGLPCVAVNVSTFICKSSSVLHERKNTAQNAGIYTFVEPIKANQNKSKNSESSKSFSRESYIKVKECS
jgi:hypothetical protein